jgi:hypothetical protein
VCSGRILLLASGEGEARSNLAICASRPVGRAQFGNLPCRAHAETEIQTIITCAYTWKPILPINF